MRALLAIIVVLPLAMLAEASALLYLLTVPGSLSWSQMVILAGLHLFASVAAAEGLGLRFVGGARGRSGGAWQLGLVQSLFLPGFGVLLTCLMILRPPRTVMVKEDDLQSPMEFRKQQAEAELAAEADKGVAGVNVEAMVDALKDKDKAKRLGAVAALQAIENKQAVELLGNSIENTVFEVRYHAVEALSSINKKYSQRIAEASRDVEDDPSPAHHGKLGEVYHEFASLEMEDPSIQAHLFRNAVENLRAAVDGGVQDPALWLKLGDSLENTGEHAAARQIYDIVLQYDPRSMEALLGIARLQYRLAQFDDLPITCRQILSIDPHGVSQEYLDVLALWAEGPQALGV